MAPLADLVRASIQHWDGDLEEALVGTRDPVAVASALTAFCGPRVGEPLEGIFYSAGVGLVAGLRLADGTSVVLKVHRWNISLDRLLAIHAVQEHAWRRGLPAPRPRAAPAPLGAGLAVIEEHLPGQRPADAHAPSVRAALATALHAFVGVASELVAAHGPDLGTPLVLRSPDEPLWPEPHDLRFDFESTSAGAGWIDELAREARARLQGITGSPVVGHFDWRVQNLAFAGDRVSAIYDWDALCATTEAVVVGGNAAQFCTDWSSDDPHPLPTVEDMRAFVDDYEHAHGRPFTPAERADLDAANLGVVAYGARCQHSDTTLRPGLGWHPEELWCGLLRQRGAHALDA